MSSQAGQVHLFEKLAAGGQLDLDAERGKVVGTVTILSKGGQATVNVFETDDKNSFGSATVKVVEAGALGHQDLPAGATGGKFIRITSDVDIELDFNTQEPFVVPVST